MEGGGRGGRGGERGGKGRGGEKEGEDGTTIVKSDYHQYFSSKFKSHILFTYC